MALRDNDTAKPARCPTGHGDSSGSYEYLVFRSILEGVAKDHGFRPITDFQDPRLDKLFQKVGLNQENVYRPDLLPCFKCLYLLREDQGLPV